MLTKLVKNIPINDHTDNTDTNSVSIHNRIFSKQLVIEYLNNLSLSLRKLTSIAIVDHLKTNNADQSIIDCYGEIARDSRIEDTILRTKRAATLEEEENFMAWDDIVILRTKFKQRVDDGKVNQRDKMKYVVLCLYTMIPPQRGQIFYNCYIDKDVPTANMIKLSTAELLLREYKTKRIYDIKIIKLPQELIDVLTWWKPQTSTGLLLPNTKNKAMDTSSFTNFMYSIFYRNISTDMLRKIYVSYRLKQGMTMTERKELADAMGHSVLVQDFYYNKKEF